MVDFVNDSSSEAPTTALPSTVVADQPRLSMSLGQLSWEYAAYLLLNQSNIDQSTMMATAVPSFPSLLPYANLFTLLQQTNNPLIEAAMLAPPPPQPSIPLIAAATPFKTPTPPILDDSLHNSISKNKLGRSYNPGRPLAMADRQRILDLYKKGHKISHIARIIGVTHSCVSKIMTRYRRTGSMHPRSAQLPRKNSSSSTPERSSASPDPSAAESDSSICSSAPIIPNAQSPFESFSIHKPIPVKGSVYCASD